MKTELYAKIGNFLSLLFYVDLLEEVSEVSAPNPLAERLKQGAGKTNSP